MFDRRRYRAPFERHITYNSQSNMNPYTLGMYNQFHVRQQPQAYYPNLTENWGGPYLPQQAVQNQPSQPGYHPYPITQNPMNHSYPGMNPYTNYHMQQYGQPKQQSYAKSIFQNPLEPEMEPSMTNSNQLYGANPYMNPYPKQSFIPKQPSGVKSIMNSFKAQDGSIDINKMMDTAGTMMNAVNQVSSMVKGLGGIIKV